MLTKILSNVVISIYGGGNYSDDLVILCFVSSVIIIFFIVLLFVFFFIFIICKQPRRKLSISKCNIQKNPTFLTVCEESSKPTVLSEEVMWTKPDNLYTIDDHRHLMYENHQKLDTPLT
jgi:hypothetical protein